MMISNSTQRALDQIAQRQQDLRAAFLPGGMSSASDSNAPASSTFSLDPLSVAAPPESFFITRDQAGPQMYSRDGTFHMQENMLVDRFGNPVLGITHEGGALSPLRIDRLDCVLGRATDFQIASDGTLSYARSSIDPRSGAQEQTRVAVGRLALARFSAATNLRALDATRELAPPGIAPHIGAPSDGNFAPVAPHRQERSRVDFDRGIERLQEAYMRFDALRAAHSAQGRAEKTAMDLLK